MSADVQVAKPEDVPPPRKDAGGEAGDPWWKPSLAGAVTIISLVAFFAFVIYLLLRTGDPDLAWTRSMYLLTGVEAITFAAVGWLFGKEVHRAQAQSAEKRADDAQQQKDAAVKQAAEERATGAATAELAIAAMNEALPPPSAAPTGSPAGLESRSVRGSAPATTTASGPARAALVNFVERHYPEVRMGR